MKPLGQGGRGGTGKEHGCDGTVHDLHRCGRGLEGQTGAFGAGSAQVSLILVSRTNAVPCGGSTKLTLWHFTPRSFRACRKMSISGCNLPARQSAVKRSAAFPRGALARGAEPC